MYIHDIICGVPCEPPANSTGSMSIYLHALIS